MEQRGVCDRLKEIPLQNAENHVYRHASNQQTRNMQEHTILIAICYGVGKRYSPLKLLWSETTLSLFGFVTRFMLHIR